MRWNVAAGTLAGVLLTAVVFVVVSFVVATVASLAFGVFGDTDPAYARLLGSYFGMVAGAGISRGACDAALKNYSPVLVGIVISGLALAAAAALITEHGFRPVRNEIFQILVTIGAVVWFFWLQERRSR